MRVVMRGKLITKSFLCPLRISISNCWFSLGRFSLSRLNEVGNLLPRPTVPRAVGDGISVDNFVVGLFSYRPHLSCQLAYLLRPVLSILCILNWYLGRPFIIIVVPPTLYTLSCNWRPSETFWL